MKLAFDTLVRTRVVLYQAIVLTYISSCGDGTEDSDPRGKFETVSTDAIVNTRDCLSRKIENNHKMTLVTVIMIMMLLRLRHNAYCTIFMRCNNNNFLCSHNIICPPATLLLSWLSSRVI